MGSVATLLLQKVLDCTIKNTRLIKKHQITKENLYTVKMPRKCDVMPAIDIAQLIVSQRQRKREMAATLVLVCTGMSAVLL